MSARGPYPIVRDPKEAAIVADIIRAFTIIERIIKALVELEAERGAGA